jgi:hypothetical protein
LPLFVPGGEIPDPAMLAREKEMEVVLKLAQRVDKFDAHAGVQLRITEFGADGQKEIETPRYNQQALNMDQLFAELTDDEGVPWATLDAAGNLLLWSDEHRLADALGIEDHRFSSAWREGKWVLVTAWDDATQLEAWLEENPDNPSGRSLNSPPARENETLLVTVGGA